MTSPGTLITLLKCKKKPEIFVTFAKVYPATIWYDMQRLPKHFVFFQNAHFRKLWLIYRYLLAVVGKKLPFSLKLSYCAELIIC